MGSGPGPGQNNPQELHFEHFCIQAWSLARISLRSFILSIFGLRPGTWPETALPATPMVRTSLNGLQNPIIYNASRCSAVWTNLTGLRLPCFPLLPSPDEFDRTAKPCVLLCFPPPPSPDKFYRTAKPHVCFPLPSFPYLPYPAHTSGKLENEPNPEPALYNKIIGHRYQSLSANIIFSRELNKTCIK